MDLIKFSEDLSAGLTEAELITGATSIAWIERYRDSGEFEIVAPVSSGLRTSLPEGCYISHLDTYEVMVVENHEISDEKASETEIVITGRSLETILNQRIIGSNITWPATVGTELTDYLVGSNKTWDQIFALIHAHINPAYLIDNDDAFPNILPVLDVVKTAGDSIARYAKRDELHEYLLTLLDIDDLGLKTMRPGPWTTHGDDVTTSIVIHDGVDKTADVAFSYDEGEIESGEYLWSNKNLKTSALVTGKWMQTIVHGTEDEYARRVMYVDGSDIDEDYDVAPTAGAQQTAVLASMTIRGQEALAAQNHVAVENVEIAKNSVRHAYRTDYNIGDLVMVEGNYDEETTMRVIEYVEIEDEKGEHNYPTLASIEEED